MSEDDEKRERIRSRIEASQGRLKRESTLTPAPPVGRAPGDTTPPDQLHRLAREHPFLTVATGLGAGLLLGALLPKRFGLGFGKRAIGLAGIGAELALTLSRNARKAASDNAREGMQRIEEGTAPLRRRAESAGKRARSTGIDLAGEAIKLASQLRNKPNP